MSNSPELNELAKALAAAQSQFPAVPKGSTNPFFRSSYASLPAVVLAASPIIAKHGLSVSQHLGHDNGRDTLTTWLLHESGQWINDTAILHLTKDDAQSHGSAITYARRYAYMAILGLVADEDDDGAAASRIHKAEPPPQRTDMDDALDELDDACIALGLQTGEVASKFYALHDKPPRQTDAATVRAFIDELHDAAEKRK